MTNESLPVQPAVAAMQSTAYAEYKKRLFLTVKVVLAVVAAGFLFWNAAQVFLLIFAGLLFAVFLQALAHQFTRLVPVGYGWGLMVVILILAAVIVIAGMQTATKIAEQANQLATSVRQSGEQITAYLQQYQWVEENIDLPSPGEIFSSSGSWLSRMTGVVSSMMTGVTNFVIILFIGIYGAANPSLYRRGLLHLIPISKRQRANEVIDRAVTTLRWWLVGRLLSMTVVGIVSAVGLWLLDMPMALLLGLIAFALEFVPYVGPILAAIPALMVALSMGENQVFYVALLYIAIQSVESYLLDPLVQQYSVELPPVLTIAGQLLMGILFGTLGLIVATPLIALTMTLIQAMYVEATLGEPRDTGES